MSAAEVRYDIEGELLTRQEIAARASGLNRTTVYTRLHYGDRTWARLLRKPDKRGRAPFDRRRRP